MVPKKFPCDVTKLYQPCKNRDSSSCNPQLSTGIKFCVPGRIPTTRSSIQAAQLLQSLHAQNLTGASSFSHTLRACVSVANRGQVRDAKFDTLAGQVAVRVWSVLQEQDESSPHAIRMDSYLYLHFLRACQNIPDQKKEAIVERTFQECCQRGKVNVHVLREFQAVASPQLQSKLLGSKLSKNSSEDPLKLIRKLPQEWSEHADGNRYEW